MTDYNGGYTIYADKAQSAIWWKAGDRCTKTVTVKSGQVLKALTWLESDVNGKCIAHGGIVESATLTFGASITTGQTFITAGLTFTAGSGSVTATQLGTIWKDLPVGTTAAQANVLLLARSIDATVTGTFTSGTLAGYSTTSVSATKVRFDAVGTGAASATDVALTGTGAAAGTVAITQYAALNKIAGLLCFDVDATSADVDASAYIEGSLWADAIVWAVDTAVDTITKYDGSTVAVTAYNTGAAGTSAAAKLLQSKFVEGSEFELGYLKTGEQY